MTEDRRNVWPEVFGDAPEAFRARVQETVSRMQSAHAPVRTHKKARWALAAALALALLAGTALALGRFGLLDTLSENLRRFLRPQAATLVRREIPQSGGQLANATFTVEEAACDGHQVYAVVRVHAEPNVLLMDSTAEPSWGSDWWIDHDFYAGETFSKRAYDAGRTLVSADVGVRTVLTDLQIAYDGEDILYTISLPAPEAGETALDIHTFELYGEGRSRGTLTFTPPQAERGARYSADTPIELPVSGMRLTVCTLEQTPIATYLTVEYALREDATDAQILDFLDGIWVNWLDESGEPYPEGQGAKGLGEPAEGTYRLETVYRAFDVLPQEITLEFFNGFTKQRLDTLRLPLHEAEPRLKKGE